MRVESQESRVESQNRCSPAALALWPSTLRLSTLDSRRGLTLIELLDRDHHSHDARLGGDSDHGADERRPPAPRGQPRRQFVHLGRPDEGDPVAAAVRRRASSGSRRTPIHRRREPGRTTTTRSASSCSTSSSRPRTAASTARRRRWSPGIRTPISAGQVLIQFVARGNAEQQSDDSADRLGRRLVSARA